MNASETSPPATPDIRVQDAASKAHQLDIRFTGSGSEYFRIWIVNLLLMLVTLGIYYPWAKVRRLRYFHGNTLVGNEPLDFHGNPKKMLKGYALVGVLLVLYSTVGEYSPTAKLLAFLVVMALGPALLKSSMQFRLANTSWRGLRFAFRGSLKDVYRAVLPLLLPGLVMVGALTAVPNPQTPPMWYVFTLAAVGLLTLAVMPWLLWNLKRYQHSHYALASLQTTFRATPGSFYKILLQALGLALLALLIAVGVPALMFYSVKASGPVGAVGAGLGLVAGLLPLLAILAIFVALKPFVVARMQNLVWTQTGNTSLRFRSHLQFKSLLWLTLKNWLLIILTLGLYWPFAAIALARMRLQAVGVRTHVHPDTLVAQIQGSEGDAAGDAAGDLLGIDIGL
ncbi:MAG: hypothetical protein A3F78_10070 [Burkholderiales bacterium RIFCSPLOWO2_12_FULL_61_40]|nr:MAG: hypothetical protein A3F78_10070 [Burkholderiales bacterium RIFCSPLOWO2_12_FULL_61_40]